MLKEFKEFALKGNVMDLAVGVIIGAAFGKIITSAVDDLIMPVIGKVTGGVDFSNFYLALSEVPAGTEPTLAAVREAGVPVPELARFLRDVDLMGVQRHLKVLGIFARLDYRDGKPRYLADAPRFLGYLREVIPAYPELAPLGAILERYATPQDNGPGAA